MPFLPEEHFARLRERFVPLFEEKRLAGENTRHSRQDNLQAIRRLREGHWHYTFGIEGLSLGDESEILGQIASLTGCSGELGNTTKGGLIDAGKTFQALWEAGLRLRQARGKRIFLGTGHPGSLLGFYLSMARILRERGFCLPPPPCGMLDATREVDEIGGVSLLEDRASILHSHEVGVGMIALRPIASEVALAICDHAYGGAALNLKIPLVVIMDTNDPAFAVAKAQGMDLTVIPMDDNRPQGAYYVAAELLAEILDLPCACDHGGATGSC